MAFFGLYLAACWLLAGAGLAKMAKPANTALALSQLGPLAKHLVRITTVRLVAALELALGLVALAWPAWWSASAVAASFLAFGAFALVARARGGALATCGCFGEPDTPPTLLHVVLNAVFSTAGVAVALAMPAGSTLSVLGRQYAGGWPLACGSALVAYLAWLVMGPMARLGYLRAQVMQGAR